MSESASQSVGPLERSPQAAAPKPTPFQAVGSPTQLDPAIVEKARKLSMTNALEKLRKGFDRQERELRSRQQEHVAAVDAARDLVLKIEQELRTAKHDLAHRESELQEVLNKLASLPERERSERDGEAARLLGIASIALERQFSGQFALIEQARQVRLAATTQHGEATVADYERARFLRTRGADEQTRKANRALEREERSRVPAYAEAADRVEDAPEITLPLFLFRPTEPKHCTLVLPLRFDADAAWPHWRLLSAFASAASEAAQAADGVPPEFLRVGEYIAIQLRANDVHTIIQEAIEAALNQRPSLVNYKIKPTIEMVEAELPSHDVIPRQDMKDHRPRVAAGGTLQELAQRLGMQTAALVIELCRRNQHFPDDTVDAGGERTLHQMFGIETVAVPAASAAPALSDDAGESVGSVGEAVERVQRELPGRLVVQSEIENDSFNDPSAVYRALRCLATTYWDAKTGTKRCVDLDLSFREQSGFCYRSSQSAVTMGEFASDYEVLWNGRRVRLEEHIGKGNSKDARTTIRVAWHWDDKSRVVVIGYIGQHQRTRAT